MFKVGCDWWTGMTSQSLKQLEWPHSAVDGSVFQASQTAPVPVSASADDRAVSGVSSSWPVVSAAPSFTHQALRFQTTKINPAADGRHSSTCLQKAHDDERLYPGSVRVDAMRLVGVVCVCPLPICPRLRFRLCVLEVVMDPGDCSEDGSLV